MHAKNQKTSDHCRRFFAPTIIIVCVRETRPRQATRTTVFLKYMPVSQLKASHRDALVCLQCVQGCFSLPLCFRICVVQSRKAAFRGHVVSMLSHVVVHTTIVLLTHQMTPVSHKPRWCSSHLESRDALSLMLLFGCCLCFLEAPLCPPLPFSSSTATTIIHFKESR